MEKPDLRTRRLVAVKLDYELHLLVKELAQDETGAGRQLTISDIYEAALRSFLSAAGRNPEKK